VEEGQRRGVEWYYGLRGSSPSYPLPVSHFLPGELQQLERKVLPAIFARSGFNRNTSRNILFGPTRLGGAGFCPFSTEQGVGQLQYFVKHWTHPLEPRQLLRIAVSWAQLNVGVSYSIFHNVVPSLPHFESKWLASLRHFLQMIQGTLRLDTTFVPEIQRVNDTHIMDHVLEQGLFSKREISRINYCRLYLQAVTVRDISLASGTSLAPGIRNGHPTLWSGVTRYLKTNQACPNAATWKIWSRTMDLLATPDDMLYVTLRQWMVPPSRQRCLWPVYYDPRKDSLYFRRWHTFERHRQSSNVFPYLPYTDDQHLPETAYPVSVLEVDCGWRVPFYSSYCPVLPSLPHSSFASFCSLLEDWESQLLQTVTFLYDPFNLVSLLESQDFRACSNGSAVQCIGSYG
jgi:hypothetical protein